MAKIEWTEDTWNPITGCSIVSTECKNCYAMTMARRLELMGQKKYAGTTEVREHIEDGKVVSKHVVWTGKMNFDEAALLKPVDRKKPTMYFVNSMSDLYHENVEKAWLDMIYKTMQSTGKQHTYQILTKRPERMKKYLESEVPVPWGGFIFGLDTGKNIWHGTSVGYRPAKSRIEVLRTVKSAVRFLSCEPLLEDLGELDLTGIHWVIIGGESGHGARPMELAWARNIVKQCREQNVKIFVKQLGGVRDKRGSLEQFPEDLRIREFPKAGH